MASPPSCLAATSNETRVRVDGLSKIMASILPAIGLAASPLLERGGAVEDAAQVRPVDRVEIEEAAAHGGVGPAGGRDQLAALGELVLGDGQRRQQAHDLVGRRHGDQAQRPAAP